MHPGQARRPPYNANLTYQVGVLLLLRADSKTFQ